MVDKDVAGADADWFINGVEASTISSGSDVARFKVLFMS